MFQALTSCHLCIIPISQRSDGVGEELDGGFRAHSQDELVGFGVDDLLGEREVGEGQHCAQQGGVPLPQLKQDGFET